MALAAAGDIDEIWALYVQLFEVVPGEALVPQMDLDDRNPSGQDDWQQSDDNSLVGAQLSSQNFVRRAENVRGTRQIRRTSLRAMRTCNHCRCCGINAWGSLH